ncbi:hypothetical protein [Hydrogenimonas thermophila]|uniref:Uncharacterized protein n=1 Tax=Hydrogenimonas thermophila TaxID=223786 RepID=A0A1I5TZZ1_9BACT|nr:hypothetical protein [Hydrogenimonas thermophila]SFP88615.1 hypothetical protein SAMN05216234_1522 [Hydrogenimonas thermophila]
MKADNEIVLFYKQPIYKILTKTLTFKSYLAFILLILIVSFLECQKNDTYNYVSTFASIFIITITWILFQIFIYINFIPAFISLKKYRQLTISDDYIKINNTKYKISELKFQKDSHSLYRHPLSWTYLLIQDTKDNIVGKFIFEINNYKFFGISCDIILAVLNQKEKNIDQDYHKFIYNSNINEYLESKNNKNSLKKALFIIIIPLLLILSILIIFKFR